MTNKQHSWIARHKFLILMLSLLLLALVHPVLSELNLIRARLLLNVFVTIILFSGVYAASEGHKRLFIIILCLALLGTATRWTVHFQSEKAFKLVVLGHILSIVFFLLIAGTILSYVLKASRVTSEKIYAAVCVYLLMGLLWGFLYSLTHTFLPKSFNIENNDLFQFIYYSYITLSTLGYGDITPLTAPAKALAYVEAITGQIYLAVLIARLVGLHIAYHQEGR